MISCLQNFIGLRHCSRPEPLSGIYLNSLPGLSTELADKIANSEQVTFEGVWDDVQQVAFLRLKSDVLAFLQQSVNFNSVLYQTQKPKRLARMEVIDPSDEYRGVIFSIPESKYAEVRIDSLGFYSQTALDDVQLLVVDEFSEEIIHTQTLDVKAGYNQIPVGFRGKSNFDQIRWFIGIDCSGLTLKRFTYNPNYTGWEPCDQRCCAGEDMVIYPATYSEATFTRSAARFSVWPQLEILCSMEQFLCENRHSFSEALLYLLGWQLLEYKINNSIGSSRLNFFNTTNLEQTRETRDTYRQQYEKSIKTSLKTIPLTGDSLCLDCEGSLEISWKGAMP